MRISQIETIPLEIPLRTPFTTAKAQQTIARLILIKLHTDTGILGVGECDPRPHITGDTMKSALSAIRDYLSPALVGMELSEAKDLAKICARMDEVLIANPSAKDGIDIAAHDALGKKNGLPVYSLLANRIRGMLSSSGFRR